MRYRAFLSYSRADERAASWLHHELDAFRVPKALVGVEGTHGAIPAKLHPVFRDKSDLSGAGALNAQILEALNGSEALVVLCSPAAAASEWVEREARLFIEQGKAGRIFLVISPSAPDSVDIETDFYPPCLRGRDLIAADLREIRRRDGRIVGDGRRLGRTKLLAALVGIQVDQLAKREARRQRMLMGGLGAAALMFAALATVAIGQMLAARQNEQRALNAVTRMFAERAWDARDSGDFALAARYAIAGWRMAPGNEVHYRAALAALLYEANDSIVLAGHGAPVLDAAFDPAGARVLTAAADGAVRLWDANSGQLLRELRNDGVKAFWVRFSGDGQIGAGIFSDGETRVWDLASGRVLHVIDGESSPRQDALAALGLTPPVWQDQRYYQLAFSPDGERLLTSAIGAAPRLTDVRTGAMIARLEGHRATVASAAFSPDGRHLITASGAREVILRDALTGRVLADLSEDQDVSFPGGVGFNVASDRMLIQSREGPAVWSLAPLRRLAGIRDFSMDAVLSPAGDFVVLSGAPASIWNVETGEVRDLGSAGGFSGATPVFSPDGRHVVVGANAHDAAIWDARTGAQIALLRGHQDYVLGARFSADGAKLVTVSMDGTARIWRAEGRAYTGRLVLRLEGSSGFSARLTPDGLRLIFANRDSIGRSDAGSAGVMDVRSGRELGSFGATTGAIEALSFHPSRAEVALSGQRDPITIWNYKTGAQVRVIETMNVHRARFDPDGLRIASGHLNGWVRVWEAQTGRLITEWNYPGLEFAEPRYSPDGALLALGTQGANFVEIRDAHSLRVLRRLEGVGDYVQDFHFSPDGSRLAVIYPDYSMRLWDVEDWRLIVAGPAHGALVTDFSFSSDGHTFMTAAFDGEVKIWDAETGRHLRTFHEGRDAIRSASFSPDGRLVIAAAGENLHIWDRQAGVLLTTIAGDGRNVEWAEFSADSQILSVVTWGGVIRLFDSSALTSPMDDAVTRACAHLLLEQGRRFSDVEGASDALISEVWMNGRSAGQSDLCDGEARIQ